MAKRDTRYLERRYRTWYCVQDVPLPLRKALGRKRMVQSLKTHDLHVAIAKRYAVLAEFEAVFAKARKPAEAQNITDAALMHRRVLEALDRGDGSVMSIGGPDEKGFFTTLAGKRAFALGLVADEADDLEFTHGADAANTFRGIACGTATPLDLHVAAWLQEGGRKGPLSPRTKEQYRADLGHIIEWLKAQGAATIEAHFILSTKSSSGC
jgi:hypothetical protein